MNYSFLNLLTLLGALVLFLYGMKMMSESLQKVAGSRMRKILAAMTSNRFFGVLTGFIITSIIQSSSATTVMVVSFVNAGLLSLAEAISVIMGANIGTTITAWIVSLIGLKIQMGSLALPLLAISFPLIFSSKSTRKFWGEFIMGFSLLFMGIDLLSSSVPDLNSNPQILSFLNSFTDYGFGSILIFVIIGTILTMILQSSSATMALTLVMCYNGWIGYEHAAAMVLGENIGTTITANIAALVANTTAKQAALTHTFFNVFGVLWVLALFSPYTQIIANFAEKIDGESAYNSAKSIPIALSLFHTTFNLSNVIIQVWFIKYLEKFVKLIIHKKNNEEESFDLKYLQAGLLSTAELSILQARKEIIEYAKKAKTMFDNVQTQLSEIDNKKQKQIATKIAEKEKSMDKLEDDIANYLTKITEGEISMQGSRRIRTLLKISDNIESLADVSHNISKIILQIRKKNIELTELQIKEINTMFQLLNKSYNLTINALADLDFDHTDLTEIYEIGNKIKDMRTRLRKENIENIENDLYTYQSGVVFLDIISLCDTNNEHLINIYEALSQKKMELSNQNKKQNKFYSK